jgi:DNA-binding IclR family transcriptional regulator
MEVAPEAAGKRFKARGIQSIEIGFRILQTLSAASKPVSLTAIAAANKMTSSKVRFYLVSFLNLGLVSQDPLSGHYSLGPSAIQLGLSALEQFDVVNAARRELFELAESTGFSVFLAVWGNHGPSIVSRVDGRIKTSLEVRVGTVLPLLTSAIGRVFLAYIPRSATDLLMEAELPILRNARPRAGTLHDRVNRIIRSTRATGIAVSRGTILVGFTAVAAPILDREGLPMAAMSMTGPIGFLDDNPNGRMAHVLKEKTSMLSRQIGWNGSPDTHS